jgi:hypothetical protein
MLEKMSQRRIEIEGEKKLVGDGDRDRWRGFAVRRPT